MKVFEAELELAKAADQDQLDLDEETAKKLYGELLTLATQSVDRSRKSAELVQAAAVAIGGLYTGVLGFLFVAKDNPMPWRGIWPTVFLGLAVVLAMSYVGFITRTPGVAEPKAPKRDDAQRRLMRRAYFYTHVTRQLVQQRAHLLRAAVVSLGVGVFLLPVAFLEVGDMNIPFLSSGAAGETVEPGPSGAAPVPSAFPVPPSPASAGAASAAPWPTPEFTEPAKLAAILYRAQVAAYKAALPAVGAGRITDKDSSENWIAILLAAGGAFLVYRAGRSQWPFRVSPAEPRDTANASPGAE